MENRTILQVFVIYWGPCHASPQETQENLMTSGEDDSDPFDTSAIVLPEHTQTTVQVSFKRGTLYFRRENCYIFLFRMKMWPTNNLKLSIKKQK